MRAGVALALVIALHQQGIVIASQTEQMTWSQVAPRLMSGYHVELRLVRRQIIRGRIVSASVNGLRVDVERSTDTSAFPEEVIDVSHADVTLIRFRTGRFAAEGLGGSLAGAFAAPALQGERTKGRNYLLVAGVVAFGAWLANRKAGPTTVIQIVP